MALLFENNPASTLLSGITNVVTSLTVQAGDGTLFPSPTGNDSFRCTLEDAAGLIEIVDVTNRTGDVFTIVRAQEGTTGKAYVAGDAVELRVTKEVLEGFLQSIERLVTDKGGNYSIVNADNHNVINMTGAFIPSLPDAGTVQSNFFVFIKNSHSADITVGRLDGTDSIDGVVGDDILASQQGACYVLNSTTNGYLRLSSEVFSSLVTTTLTASGVSTFNGNIESNAELRINSGYNEDAISYTVTTGTKSIDTAIGTYFYPAAAMTATTVDFTFDNPVATGRVTSFMMELSNMAVNTDPTPWPTSVDWANGAEPSWTTGIDIVAFWTRDGGVIWHGSVVSLDSK